MRPTIFFDLDGVLADFVGGALAIHGRTDIPQSEVTWGIEAQLKIEASAFWSPLGYEFWSNLSPLRDGLALLEAAEYLVGAPNIGLLTSPCDTEGCVEGKRAWVAEHLPDYRRRLFVGSAKELFAAPTKILIDDHDKNYMGFIGAGGFGVMPPRPWNMRRRECVGGHSFDLGSMCSELRAAVDAAARGVR